MSAAEIIEQMRPLPTAEKRALVEQIWQEFGEELDWVDEDLTPEEAAELDRRAEEALRHPGRGIPLDEVSITVGQPTPPRK